MNLIFDYLGNNDRHTSTSVVKPDLVWLLEDLSSHYASESIYSEYKYQQLLLQVEADNLDCISWAHYIEQISSLLLTKLTSLQAPNSYLSLVNYILLTVQTYMKKSVLSSNINILQNNLDLALNPIEYSLSQSLSNLNYEAGVSILRYNNKTIYNIDETKILFQSLLSKDVEDKDYLINILTSTNSFYDTRWIMNQLSEDSLSISTYLQNFLYHLNSLYELEYASTTFTRRLDLTFNSDLSTLLPIWAKLFDELYVLVSNYSLGSDASILGGKTSMADLTHLQNSYAILFNQKEAISRFPNISIPVVPTTAPTDATFIQWEYDTTNLIKSLRASDSSLSSFDLDKLMSINKDITSSSTSGLSPSYVSSKIPLNNYNTSVNNQTGIFEKTNKLYQYLGAIGISLAGLYAMSLDTGGLTDTNANLFANLTTTLINVVTSLLKVINVISCALKALLCNLIATVSFLVMSIYNVLSSIMGYLGKGLSYLLDGAGVPSMESVLSILNSINPLAPESIQALKDGISKLSTEIMNMPMVKDLIENLESMVPGIGSFLNTYGLSVADSVSAAKKFMSQDMMKTMSSSLSSSISSAGTALKSNLGDYDETKQSSILNAFDSAGHSCANSFLTNNPGIFETLISDELGGSTNPLFQFIDRCSVKGANSANFLKKFKLKGLSKFNLDKLGQC